jgi:hypothetical protein
MADRKQTPDVLGDLLGAATPQVPPAPEPAPPSQSQSTGRAGRERTRQRASKSSQKAKWDYLLVSFQDYKGWRPRFVNGRELADWMNAPIVHDYVDQLGEEGWELSGASAGQNMYGLTDRYQLYFKRPKR